jgi:disulfide bond formation protein DsbB
MVIQRLEHRVEEDATRIARIINVLALFALIGVLAGSLHLQLGVGEQPCPLCLVQRSAMIGLAVGPVMNLLWGMRPAHYAMSIVAAVVGSAGSIRQILLHIQPGDPGYGPAVLGLHLYTWAFLTFVIAILGCAAMLLWSAPFQAHDDGIRDERRWFRVIALTAIIWAFLDLLIIAISVIPECGLGMCPDDPPNITGAGDIPGWLIVLSVGLLAFAFALAIVLNRKILPHVPPTLRDAESN